MNVRAVVESGKGSVNVGLWVLTAVGVYVPRFGFRGFGAGSSLAVMRSSSPSHSALSHRSASISKCGLAPEYGGASDTGSEWTRPDAVGFTKS